MRSMLLALLLLVSTVHAVGADLQADFLKRLDASPVLRGDFEQTRTLKGFRNALVSRGAFVFARGHGVVWDTKEPFASSLVITRDKLLARRADGSVSTQMDAAREPALRMINELMFALLGGDLSALGRQFDVSGEADDPQGWRLALTPTDKLLGGQFNSIALEGASHVSQVRLAERNGDLTVIRFSHVHGESSVDKDVLRRFEDQHGG